MYAYGVSDFFSAGICKGHAQHDPTVSRSQLPFYDDGTIRTLQDFEELVYQNLP